MLSQESMGLFLKSNSNRREYNDHMLNNVQAFAQNAGEGIEAISEIVSAITNGQSPEETHKQIQIRNKQQQRVQEKLQQQEQQRQLELLEKQKELQQQLHQQELDKIKFKGDFDLEESRQDNETAINVAQINQQNAKE